MKQQEDSEPAPFGRLALQRIPLPVDTNASGDIAGGWVLLQMDTAAEETARSLSKGRVAMVCCDKTSFLSPVKIGGLISCYTHILETGISSIKIQVEVWAQKSQNDALRKVCDSVLVYVAIDEKGRIRALPN